MAKGPDGKAFRFFARSSIHCTMSHPHPHPHSSTPGTLRRASWGEHGDDEDEDDSGDYEDSAYGGGDNRSQPGGMYAGVYGDEAEPDGGMDINEDARPPQQVPTTLTTVSNMVSAQSAAPLPEEQIAPNTPMTARPPPHIDFVAAIRGEYFLFLFYIALFLSTHIYSPYHHISFTNILPPYQIDYIHSPLQVAPPDKVMLPFPLHTQNHPP